MLLRARNTAFLLWVVFFVCGFDYQVAVPGRKIAFPRDHSSHPDFKTEWWYYTGHLLTNDKKSFGYQVTFFRYGLRDRQREAAQAQPLFTDLYLAHFALSDRQAKKFTFYDRATRGYADKAGALTDRYWVWNEDWKAGANGIHHSIDVRARDIGLNLQLLPLKPPVLHGLNGLSQKSEGRGRASYYYSLTRLKTEGDLLVAGKNSRVQGLSWMDHEFATNQLGEEQVGWDWFSLQLDKGMEIMLYQMRRKDGSPDGYSSGTVVYETGSAKQLKLADFRIEVLERWRSPRSHADYPMRWRVTIPSEALRLEIVPIFPNQELDTRKSTQVTYWEGAVEVRGMRRGETMGGQGYVEMTGYASKLGI